MDGAAMAEREGKGKRGKKRCMDGEKEEERGYLLLRHRFL